MKKKILLILILYIINGVSYGQSLLELKEQLLSESGLKKTQTQLKIANLLIDTDTKEALSYSQDALKTANALKNTDLISNAELLNARAFLLLQKYKQAEESAKNAATIFNGKNKKNYAFTTSLLGDIYLKQSAYSDSYINFVNSYNTYINLADDKNAAYSAYSAGNIAEFMKKQEESIEWYKKAQTLFEKTGRQKDEIKTYITIGSIYNNYGNYLAAEDELKKAINKSIKYGLTSEQQKIESKLDVIQKNISSKERITTSYDKKIETEQKEYVQNIENQKAKSLVEIEKLSTENQLIELKIKAQQDDYNKKILEEQIERLKIEEDLQKEKTAKEKITLELQNEKLISEKKSIENQRLFIMLASLLLITILILIGFFIKRKNNIILQKKNNEIIKQKSEIEIKTKHISQSIDYAKRVQTAILPAWKKLEETFSNSFIYLRPKDKVSGDFFWFHKINDFVFIAAADCTGHGVPGAFMSIIMSNILDKVVKEQKYINPDKALEQASFELTNMVIERGYNLADFKDGMDIALLRINLKEMELVYAGAHNPTYIIRNNRLTELKPSKRSVNIILPENKLESFISHNYKLEKMDKIYIFSDGFPDQKGGEKKNKFYYPPFRNYLLMTSQLPIEKQKEAITIKFEEWKGNEEQIDDVLIVGIEI